MGEAKDGEERQRKIGSEDPTIHEPAGTEGETLGPESAMDAIRVQRGVDVDPGVEIDEPSAIVSQTPSGPVAPPTGSQRRYTVRGEIARGGMGAIFKVRDEDLRRSLAMKVMLGKVSRAPQDRAPFEPDRLARFLEEAQVTAQLAHPGVVPVHELGVDDTGRVFFTMSLVRGKTLSEIIELAREGRDGWDRARALQTLLRVCETVAFAHDKGVIHRDLKPANVMVGKFGEVYVMDWGLAKVRGQEDRHDIRLRAPDAPTSTRIQTDRTESESDHDSPIMTMDGAVVGTPCYMPPEQAKGQVEEVDERSDVYAIGAMLYQLLAGRPPYVEPGARISPRTLLMAVIKGPPTPIHELAPDAPEELQAITGKAMARDRGKRYDSAKSLADDVQRFLSGHVVQAHRTGALIELRKWVQRNRGIAATAAAALVVVAGLTGVYLDRLGDRTERAELAEADAREKEGRAQGERKRALAAESLATQRAEEAEAERDERLRAARKSRALALAHLSLLAQEDDSMFSLMLAHDAAEVRALPEVTARLREALLNSRERAVLRGHETAATSVVFSPGGDRVASASKQRMVRLWTVAGDPLPLLGETKAAGWSPAFSPDGMRLVMATSSGARILRADGAELASIRTPSGYEFDTVEFTPLGDAVFTTPWAPEDPRARLFDLSGNELASFDCGPGLLCDLSPRGDRVLTTWDATVHLWDIGGEHLAALVPPEASGWRGGLLEARFSPAGDSIWVQSERGVSMLMSLDGSVEHAFEEVETVMLTRLAPDGLRAVGWEPPVSPGGIEVSSSEAATLMHLGRAVGGLPFREQLVGHSGRLGGARFSPSGDQVVTWSEDSTARIWEGRDEVAVLRAGSGAVRDASFSPDGSLVATAADDGTVRIWAAYACEVAALRGQPDRVTAATFVGDGARVATGAADGSCRIWDLGGHQLAVLGGHEGRVNDVVSSPDGSRLVTASDDGTAWIWDTVQARRLVRLDEHGSPVMCAAFSPSGETVATGSGDGLVRVWAMDGSLMASYGAPDRPKASPPPRRVGPWFVPAPAGALPVDDVRFSADGRHILTTSLGLRVQLWRLGAAEPRLSLGFAGLEGIGGDLSPSGGLVVQGSRIWDTDGQPYGLLPAHDGGQSLALFSPARATVLSAGTDGSALIAGIEGHVFTELIGHTNAVTAGAFSADGALVATGSLDGTTRLWDADGRQVAVLAGHQGNVEAVLFSTAGTHLLTRDEHVARLWSVDAERLVALAATRRVRDYTREELDALTEVQEERPSSHRDGATAAAMLGREWSDVRVESGVRGGTHVVAASGPFAVGRDEVHLQSGESLGFTPQQALHTRDATLELRCGPFHRLALGPRTKASIVDQEGGAFLLELQPGAAAPEAPAGAVWFEPPPEGSGPTTVFWAPGRAGGSTCRAIVGSVVVHAGDYEMHVPAQHTVELFLDPMAPEAAKAASYRTAQQNPGEVGVWLTVGEGRFGAHVPKASSGWFRMVEQGQQLKIVSDGTSLKTAKTRIEALVSGTSPRRAELGPGTYALIGASTASTDVPGTTTLYAVPFSTYAKERLDAVWGALQAAQSGEVHRVEPWLPPAADDDTLALLADAEEGATLAERFSFARNSSEAAERALARLGRAGVGSLPPPSERSRVYEDLGLSEFGWDEVAALRASSQVGEAGDVELRPGFGNQWLRVRLVKLDQGWRVLRVSLHERPCVLAGDKIHVRVSGGASLNDSGSGPQHVRYAAWAVRDRSAFQAEPAENLASGRVGVVSAAKIGSKFKFGGSAWLVPGARRTLRLDVDQPGQYTHVGLAVQYPTPAKRLVKLCSADAKRDADGNHFISFVADGTSIDLAGLEASPKGPIEPARPPKLPAGVASDQKGEQPFVGVVEIADVDRSTLTSSGTVRYYVNNVSGQLQEDLSWSVVFFHPARQRDDGLSLPYDTEVTAAEDLVMVAGKSRHELVATSREFAARTASGEKLLATRLVVQKVELVPMVARDASGAGTKVLNGRLECVGLSPADDLYKDPPGLWIDLENVSGEPVNAVEVKAVFMSSDMRMRAGETGWHAIAGVQPGGTQRVTLDLSRIPASVARTGSFVAKVRWKSIFGF